LNLIARFIEQELDKEKGYEIFQEETKIWSGQIFYGKYLDELIGYNNIREERMYFCGSKRRHLKSTMPGV
jgi:hypothetical protein